MINKYIVEESPRSGNVDSFVYIKRDKILLVTFTFGGTYAYQCVQEEVVEDLVRAESAGKFIAANVKNKYNFLKV